MAFQCALDTQSFYDSRDVFGILWIIRKARVNSHGQWPNQAVISMVDSKTDGQHFLQHLFQKSPEKNVQGRTVHFMAKSLIDSEKWRLIMDTNWNLEKKIDFIKLNSWLFNQPPPNVPPPEIRV